MYDGVRYPKRGVLGERDGVNVHRNSVGSTRPRVRVDHVCTTCFTQSRHIIRREEFQFENTLTGCVSCWRQSDSVMCTGLHQQYGVVDVYGSRNVVASSTAVRHPVLQVHPTSAQRGSPTTLPRNPSHIPGGHDRAVPLYSRLLHDGTATHPM